MHVKYTIIITNSDKKLICEWFEYYSQNSKHYGSGPMTLPEEQKIIQALSLDTDRYTYTPHQLDIIHGWMMRTLNRKYGYNAIVYENENPLFQTLHTLFEKSETDLRNRRNQLAAERDAVIIQELEAQVRAEPDERKTTIEEEEEDKIDDDPVAKKLREVSKRLKTLNELKSSHSDRSFEEKIASAKKMRDEMHKTKDKLKGILGKEFRIRM
ncbi:MAG: hypothetical protein OCD76_10505 [Reichenbachiella sp.]